ncbi:MAG: hypothetical protein V4691_00905 [Pseudomonadota bacterium]
MRSIHLETLKQPLAKRSLFFARLGLNLLFALAVIAISLIVGMAGYHYLDDLGWVDAFLNAAMILGGMGPVAELHSDASKIFAGAYAIYCGLLLIAMTGLLLGPVFHRVMHKLHAADSNKG